MGCAAGVEQRGRGDTKFPVICHLSESNPERVGGRRGHTIGSGGRIVWLGNSRKVSGISIGSRKTRNSELKVASRDCI